MGIPKPKYDPKMKKPQTIRPTKDKPYMVLIPEREPTEEELIDIKKKKEYYNLWPDWMMPWVEHRIGKYATRKAAETAVKNKLKKMKSKSLWDFRFREYERMIIVKYGEMND